VTNRPRNIANDILDAVESATARWTKQKKSEERTPGNVRYRRSRMTKEPTTKQKDAAWEIMEEAYMAASANDTLPANARQVYYQARPLIMALTDDKALKYDYFSQTLLPNYIEENSLNWDVVYDARGHFEEPHTSRSMGCSTIEVRDYLGAVKPPEVTAADFAQASIDVVGPDGGYGGIMFCEKEGFDPLFKSVDLANRHDLLIISSKGQSVTAMRKLIDEMCGDHGLPLFVLHDFDVAGFSILGTLSRDTRRYTFENDVEVVDLGLRLEDIAGLAREPAAASKIDRNVLRAQLKENGATPEEIAILMTERVELNAMPSDALVAMIERKLAAYGLEKVVPGDKTLDAAYRAFHRSRGLRRAYAATEKAYDAKAKDVEVPKGLQNSVRTILNKHRDLRWDDAVQIVLDKHSIKRVRANKAKARKKAGDFTNAGEE
jgi:hypothetical protein